MRGCVGAGTGVPAHAFGRARGARLYVCAYAYICTQRAQHVQQCGAVRCSAARYGLARFGFAWLATARGDAVRARGRHPTGRAIPRRLDVVPSDARMRAGVGTHGRVHPVHAAHARVGMCAAHVHAENTLAFNASMTLTPFDSNAFHPFVERFAAPMYAYAGGGLSLGGPFQFLTSTRSMHTRCSVYVADLMVVCSEQLRIQSA